MTYEWDVRRARRSRLTRWSMTLGAVALAVGIPIWIMMDLGLIG